MLDFVRPRIENTKNGTTIRPEFILRKTSDLLVKGGDFYAVWDEENDIWSKDSYRLYQLIDEVLFSAKAEAGLATANVLAVSNVSASNNSVSYLKQYMKTMPDSKAILDEYVTFLDDKITKDMYRSVRLPYNLADGDTPAFDRIMQTLYPKEELSKLLWAIGAILSGDSRKIQKFIVLYGDPGSGKSTFLNILEMLFPGYYESFSSSRLATRTDQFALEPLKSNPLIAIEHDGDLSRIEDNTRLNSLVSHEKMTMNEKFKSQYSMRFNSFLFMGTNKPVKITDAQSGLIRRLIDVWPGDDRVPQDEYDMCMAQIPFEAPYIAKKCLDFYIANKHSEDHYIPSRMIQMTDPFFDFMQEKAEDFTDPDDNVATLKSIWAAYKLYADDTNMSFRYSMQKVKAEAMNYYYEYKERYRKKNGDSVRQAYIGLRKDKLFRTGISDIAKNLDFKVRHDFIRQESIFDKLYANCPAQEANEDGKPVCSWDKCTTTLKDIDTSKLHYVRGMEKNHIVIDFDLKDENGEKSFEKNLEASKRFPPTYAEVSKSGSGIHLHYIYDGDVSKLSALIAPNIEVKVFNGLSSLRRMLTLCNKLAIATISSGLPLKEEKVIDFKAINDEQHLRNIVLKHLRKEIVSSTSQSMSLIKATLDEAYASGISYDLTALRPAVLTFAANSSHHARECIAMMKDFKWQSENMSVPVDYKDDSPFVFFDVEVYPNLFVVVWKEQGEDKKCVPMINPSALELEPLFERKLIGFNCKRYDNHICYARHAGYDLEALYILSQRIIGDSKNCTFREAENLSYTDIYDFSSKKQSLKKWEIELGIHHQEMAIPWDKPVPDDMISKVVEYCCNDVNATEAVFNHLKEDWNARQMLAAIAGSTPNDSTNHLTSLIIMGSLYPDKTDFRWRNLATPVKMESLPGDVQRFLKEETCLPLKDFIPQSYGGMENPKMVPSVSDLPYFPGYAYTGGKSMYRGEDVGSGGYVYAEPGIHFNVALLDIASMHPSSAILECIFGSKFTKRFKDIKDLRIYIKHKEWDKVKSMWDGKLAAYVDDPGQAKALAYALKIAINSVYGLTSAVFENPFRNMENVDNIVAKRGALFMVDLKHAVQEKGFQVAHIKTDSIKIPNATPEIVQFVIDMGHYYGYDFEHEATYDKMALVNNAVYICKHDGAWDATGAQFAVPYVFKTLFSKEDIAFGDLCETRQVKVGSIYLDFNENLPDVSNEEKMLSNINKKIKDETASQEDIDNVKSLEESISMGHNYQFVGRIGLFCPVVPGCGGALMMCRRDDGSYSSVSGTKGYRWMESEYIKANHLEDKIDYSYYAALADKAVDAISAVGDISTFMD